MKTEILPPAHNTLPRKKRRAIEAACRRRHWVQCKLAPLRPATLAAHYEIDEWKVRAIWSTGYVKHCPPHILQEIAALRPRRVFLLRLERRWSFQAIARRLDVSHATVSRYYSYMYIERRSLPRKFGENPL